MTTVNVTTIRNTVEVIEGAVTTVQITTAGPQGATGATGATGPAGQGVPVGGTTGQALVKASGTNYDTTWTTLGGTGTVISVATGTGLSGGPITTSGTISLANTAVVPGTYPLATVQVDAQGRITSASAGSAPGTDLTYDAPSRLLSSSTGADVTLPLATTTDAGLMSAADKALVNYAATVTVSVRNNSGATIPKGAAVYVTGSSGTVVTVALADASLEATAAGTLGLAQASISTNTNGTVIAVGELTGLDTSALTEGALIWLSETTGALTTTRPTQPAHGVVLGYCVKQSPGTSGIVYVKVDNGLELMELHDVLVVSPTTGQVLRRASDGLWKNAQLAYADLSGTPTLGTSAALNVGTTAGTVAAGDDSRLATNLSYTAATRALSSSTGTGTTLPLVTSTAAGLAPLSGGGTSNFLRADGTWAAPTGSVTSVSGTAPIVSSGGATPAISITAATTLADGSMSAADKSKLDGIAAGAQVNVPTDLSYTASTRLLESSTGADVTLPLFTSTAAGLTPLSGGGTSNFLRADGTWAAPGGGTVTSVGLSLPGIFSVTGSPVTSSGTLTGSLTTQVANRVWAGPTTGADATPTFRALVAADIPNTFIQTSDAPTATGRWIFSVNNAASAPPVSLTGTWFSGGTATTTKPHFLLEPAGTTSTAWSTSGTGLGVNAPAGFAGNLLDAQVAGVSSFRVTHTGDLDFGNSATGKAAIYSQLINVRSYYGSAFIYNGPSVSNGLKIGQNNTGYLDINGSNTGCGFAFPNGLTYLSTDAANNFAQRNGTNAQSYRLYNTYTSSTSFERLNLAWSSNTLLIGTEKGSGGGTARSLEIQTDAITRLAFDTIGSVRIVTALTVATLPASPTTGMVARVNNALSPTLGATVAGGGSANALVWYNGTNWTVFGI